MLNEALVWMAKAIEEFGLSSLDVKLLIDWMIADLGSSNVGVRNAATTLLGTAHKQLGPGLVPMLSQHVKPALMTSLNDAFKANPLTKVHARFHMVVSRHGNHTRLGVSYSSLIMWLATHGHPFGDVYIQIYGQLHFTQGVELTDVLSTGGPCAPGAREESLHCKRSKLEGIVSSVQSRRHQGPCCS